VGRFHDAKLLVDFPQALSGRYAVSHIHNIPSGPKRFEGVYQYDIGETQA
jgi:hypothetical protein